MSWIKREKRTPKPIWNAIRQVNKGFFKYNVKLNLNKLRNTLRTTLVSVWEYVIPIWKISGLFKSIKSKKDLENFIQERSAHVTQTTLYGYLKTRIGVKYIAMMEDERFLKSINLSLIHIWRCRRRTWFLRKRGWLMFKGDFIQNLPKIYGTYTCLLYTSPSPRD